MSLINHLDGIPIANLTARANADLTGDGEVDEADAAALIRMLLGMEEEAP